MVNCPQSEKVFSLYQVIPDTLQKPVWPLAFQQMSPSLKSALRARAWDTETSMSSLKGGSIHPLTMTGRSAMHYHHNDTLTDLSSHPDPQTLTQPVAHPTEDTHSSDTLLHIKANPRPGPVCLPLLKSLCPSITALCPHSSPVMTQLFQQRWSSVTAHTALVPPAWPIHSLATTFLFQCTLQFTTRVISVGFHYNSLIKALGLAARRYTVQQREVSFRPFFLVSLRESSFYATSNTQSSRSKKEPWQRGACKTTVHLFAILASIWAVVFSVSLGGIQTKHANGNQNTITANLWNLSYYKQCTFPINLIKKIWFVLGKLSNSVSGAASLQNWNIIWIPVVFIRYNFHKLFS